ncbi:MAG: MBL fold metallo-hydrolase [Endomicrobia bacterium]|nr:MBL fold metallo-hydrolase [Endomicrobiia bacterium]MCX7715836.1 MBL fold metallo-hydrolase [Endomicrobiia bacterium]
MKKNYWQRQYVKRLEEIIHSGERYIFVDKILIFILLFVLSILTIIVIPKIQNKIRQQQVYTVIEQPQFEQQNQLKIVFFDVSQGDSILLTLPNSKSLLIDTGSGRGMLVEESEPGKLITEIDAGKEVIVPYLYSNNIILEGIIITHPHSDHFGGCFSILEAGFLPNWFADAGVETSHPQYYELLKQIQQKKVKYKILVPQKKLFVDPEVDIEVLGPVQKYHSDVVDRAINNSSVVIKLVYKNFSALFTGDIEIFAEMDLLEYKDKLKSKLLKVAHHGSFTSTSEPFLDYVSPEVAIISCGRGNPFGHPHQETLEKLVKRKIKIYRTDQNGNITVLTDGNFYSISVETQY